MNHHRIGQHRHQRHNWQNWLLIMLMVSAATIPKNVHALAAFDGKKKYVGGTGVGRLVMDENAGVAQRYQCHYDMVLVERLQVVDKSTASGLYVPNEALPRLHLCQVLSMGPGREEENGRVRAPMPDMAVGDWIIAKDPWGIGPKDEETMDGKKLSYMRSQNIAAVIRKS